MPELRHPLRLLRRDGGHRRGLPHAVPPVQEVRLAVNDPFGQGLVACGPRCCTRSPTTPRPRPVALGRQVLRYAYIGVPDADRLGFAAFGDRSMLQQPYAVLMGAEADRTSATTRSSPPVRSWPRHPSGSGRPPTVRSSRSAHGCGPRGALGRRTPSRRDRRRRLVRPRRLHHRRLARHGARPATPTARSATHGGRPTGAHRRRLVARHRRRRLPGGHHRPAAWRSAPTRW